MPFGDARFLWSYLLSRLPSPKLYFTILSARLHTITRRISWGFRGEPIRHNPAPHPVLTLRPPSVKPQHIADLISPRNRPHVVCIPGAVDMEFGFIQQTLPKPPTPPTSDLEGLNLNITVPPASAQKPAGGWPVLVFIHGGGLFIGANWWPQYDLKRLVRLGAERGVPFIGVNVG